VRILENLREKVKTNKNREKQEGREGKAHVRKERNDGKNVRERMRTNKQTNKQTNKEQNALFIAVPSWTELL
jgi:hypothetical protein